MRHSPDLYADALLKALEGVPQAKARETLHRFVKTVAKRGDSRRFRDIVLSIQKRLAQQKGGMIVRVEFARALEPKLSNKVKSAFSQNDLVSIATEPTLVAGARITLDGSRELDLSLRKILDDMLPASN